LGGKYLFLNELRVERTAFDKQLGPKDVVPQSNIFFSQFLRIDAAFLRIDAVHHDARTRAASLPLTVWNEQSFAVFDDGANAHTQGGTAIGVIISRDSFSPLFHRLIRRIEPHSDWTTALNSPRLMFFPLLVLSAIATRAAADDVRSLPEVEVSASRYSLIGVADSASEGVVGQRQLQSRVIVRTGELLEVVPGLIVSQHSGDGKANQYFLRGFNLDHGLDFKITLDGMPINQRSHAHGQGWADMNPLMVISRMQARPLSTPPTNSMRVSRVSDSGSLDSVVPYSPIHQRSVMGSCCMRLSYPTTMAPGRNRTTTKK
jgi:hypothetical protein